MNKCPSDFQLDRLLFANGLPQAERAAIAIHIVGCVQCQSRKEAALQPGPADIMQRLVSSVEGSEISERRRRRLSSYWPQVAVLVAASIAAFVAWPKPGPVHTAFVSPSERIKSGGIHLNVIRRNGQGRVERVLSGDTVLAGESLRFEVSIQQTAFVSIVSIDGKGNVNAFAPASGTAVSVKGGETTLLEGAVLLDDVIGIEHLVLVACRRAFEVSDAVKVAEQTVKGKNLPMQIGALPGMEENCELDELTLKKEVSP
jgi:hypothetical protein